MRRIYKNRTIISTIFVLLMCGAVAATPGEDFRTKHAPFAVRFRRGQQDRDRYFPPAGRFVVVFALA
jgi:hypothetical protein